MSVGTPLPPRTAHPLFGNDLRSDGRTIVNVLALYASLVVYEFSHRYMLEHWLSNVYGYFHLYYDADRSETYSWICFLTPLALLPAGTRLQSASQFILPVFMSFVGLPAPLYFVHFVAPSVLPYAYSYFFVCYLMLAVSTRLRFPPIPSPLGERGYKRLIWITLVFMATVCAYGMTQDFHLVSFAQLYENRYSEDANGVLVQRVAVLYVSSFGGFFFALALMFRKRLLAIVVLGVYVICYGLLYEKTALLAPLWLVYIYAVMKFFSRESTLKFYLALAAPFYLGAVWYVLSPDTTLNENPIQFVYMGTVLFRLYAIAANAPGLYHLFFQSHPHTYWSHITGINYFLRYPYGDHTIAVEMQRAFSLGNYNASFLASDAIEAYGYQAIPLAALAVGLTFMLLNTASLGFKPITLAVIMMMPSILISNIPFATSLLTSGILFLALFMAWMPKSWIERTGKI